MWDSHESVYKIIKPPEAIKPRTPPPTAKELRDRKVEKITIKLKLQLKQKPAATFGRPLGYFRPCTQKFLKKHSKHPEIIYGVQRCSKYTKRKPDVPRGGPIRLAKCKRKDWITKNAVEMIRSKPNRSKCPKKKKRYIMKKNYGKIPVYLVNRIRTAAEKKKKESPGELAKCRHDGSRKLDDKERITMMNNLKLKWAETNAKYQQMSVVLDIDSKKRRKERFERNLTNLEKDVSLLSRNVILVSDLAPPKIKKEDFH